MPPAMKRLLADLQLPANRFHRRALVEVHLRLAQLRNDLLRRVSLPFHRVLPPSRAVRLSYQLVHLEGVRSSNRLMPCCSYNHLMSFSGWLWMSVTISSRNSLNSRIRVWQAALGWSCTFCHKSSRSLFAGSSALMGMPNCLAVLFNSVSSGRSSASFRASET